MTTKQPAFRVEKPGLAITRRETLAGIGALGLATLTLDGVAAQAPKIRRGGVMTLMLEADNKSLDPLFGNSGVDRNTFNLYAEYLMLQDAKGDLKPWLAERWEMTDGGKT